jgi:DNA-binding NtrC family response regulator
LQSRDVDVLLTDQGMSGMSGLDLLNHVRVQHPSVLTMMLTANSNIDVALYAMNNVGAYKFILKPWNPDHLRRLIREAVKPATLPTDDVAADTLSTRTQNDMLLKWEKDCPGITKVERDADGVYLLEGNGDLGHDRTV